LQKVFDTANEGFWEVDNDNITIDVNPKMCAILGKTKEDLIGKDLFEFLTPEGMETIFLHHKEYRDKGQSSSYEISFKRSNSKIINCIVNAAPIFDEFGKKIGTFGMITDITYLKEAEKNLKKQIEKLDCLYEISRLLAIPNISIKDLLYGSLPLITRASNFPEKAFVRISYDENEYKSEKFRETEMKFSIVEDINEKKLEIDVYYLEENEFSEEEINLIKEIEERIKNEISRRETEQENFFLANMIENSSDAIISLNLNGTIISWNKGAEKIYGYTVNEILGKHISILAPSIQSEKDKIILAKIKNGEQIKHFEIKRLRKDGKLLDISLNLSQIKNSKGEIIGRSAIGRDFTEEFEKQKLYQEQILKSSQFKSDFMASMSHELRTPLNSIIGFSDILIEKYYGELNEQQEGYVNNIRSSGAHLLHLISEILDISKIEAGKMELNIEDIQLQKIINQIEITLRPEYEKKKLKFEVIGLNSKQIIFADSVRFKEILFNLLSNAVKYTKVGTIKLEVIELDNYWKFNVVDTGIGIKEEYFETIFNEFVRVQSAYAAFVEGTGLGLSLTRRLVELHGGNISFTSKFNEGSTFTFTLPKKCRLPQ
jgi:PAS domain S-box-containing protein